MTPAEPDPNMPWTWEAFLDMGGFAEFVWSAYGVATIVMVGLLIWTLLSLRANRKALEAMRRERRGEGSRNGAAEK